MRAYRHFVQHSVEGVLPAFLGTVDLVAAEVKLLRGRGDDLAFDILRNRRRAVNPHARLAPFKRNLNRVPFAVAQLADRTVELMTRLAVAEVESQFAAPHEQGEAALVAETAVGDQ
mgnify:CR=1 FL=1